MEVNIISTDTSAVSNNVNKLDNKNDTCVDGIELDKRNNDTQWVESTTVHMRDERISFWKLFLDNWIYVVTYCSVFGSFGVCVGFLGPTVFDLGCQTHSDLKQMNWVFFVQLIMTLVGSISAGCMADR
ncbi:unnamed protein product, partial [Candidula unifasciata]